MIADCLPVPGPERLSVQVKVTNLTETERDALVSMVAVLSDPALATFRKRFIGGRLQLGMDDGIPTWKEVP